MKKHRRSGYWVSIFLLVSAGSAWAQSDAAADMKALLERVQALETQNKALTERVGELEKKLEEQPETPPPATPEPAPAPAPPAAPNPERTFTAYWDKGLHLKTADEQFHLKIGGRIMFDVARIDGPEYWKYGGPSIDENDGSEFRRLRLRLSGEAYQDYFYKFEVDFAGNDAEIIDAYAGVRNIPYAGSIQAGQFSEPLGLEALTSASYITFMERSMATQALIPYRSRGVAVSNTYLDQRITASLGAFNGGIEQDNHWSVTGRISGVPWWAKEGRRMLHLGAAASFRNPDSEYGFYAHPGSHLADKHLDTGDLPADNVRIWGAEAALVLGPFSVQGEFIRADVSFLEEDRDLTFFNFDRPFRMSDRHFDGYYVQMSYFLTGENRPYDRAAGAFDRVRPRNPFNLAGGGWGAWELAARYDRLDLDDYDFEGGVVGGRGRSLTLGMNWYMTDNARMMFDYIRNHIDQYAYNGDIDIFQVRFQTDF